jgi:hypothetical protein
VLGRVLGRVVCLIVDNHFRADKLFFPLYLFGTGKKSRPGKNGWLLQLFMIREDFETVPVNELNE